VYAHDSIGGTADPTEPTSAKLRWRHGSARRPKEQFAAVLATLSRTDTETAELLAENAKLRRLALVTVALHRRP
jgi:hypothetical protein